MEKSEEKWSLTTSSAHGTKVNTQTAGVLRLEWQIQAGVRRPAAGFCVLLHADAHQSA